MLAILYRVGGKAALFSPTLHFFKVTLIREVLLVLTEMVGKVCLGTLLTLLEILLVLVLVLVPMPILMLEQELSSGAGRGAMVGRVIAGCGAGMEQGRGGWAWSRRRADQAQSRYSFLPIRPA